MKQLSCVDVRRSLHPQCMRVQGGSPWPGGSLISTSSSFATAAASQAEAALQRSRGSGGSGCDSEVNGGAAGLSTQVAAFILFRRMLTQLVVAASAHAPHDKGGGVPASW